MKQRKHSTNIYIEKGNRQLGEIPFFVFNSLELKQ